MGWEDTDTGSCTWVHTWYLVWVRTWCLLSSLQAALALHKAGGVGLMMPLLQTVCVPQESLPPATVQGGYRLTYSTH